MRSFAVGIALCLGFAFGSSVRAQSVALDMARCSEPAPSEVRAVLTVELAERLLRDGESVPSGALVVEVSCSGDTAEVWLRGTTARRAVALASVPGELRARLLALSVAELARPQPTATQVESADVALEKQAAEPQEVSGEEVVEERAESDATLRYFIWAGFEAQPTPLVGLGGALLFRAELVPLLAWSSAFSLSQAYEDIDRGELGVSSLSFRTGLALLLRSARGSLHLGAGVRGAWHRLSGEPVDPQSAAGARFDAWALGPAVFAGATWQIAAPLFVALELEAAHMLREVRARVEGGDATSLSPLRSSAILGAGVAW